MKYYCGRSQLPFDIADRVSGTPAYRRRDAVRLRRKKAKKPLLKAAFSEFGASYEVRTRDLDLGKVALYQLS